MSQDIVREVTFFFHSVVMGIIITFAYDWLLILRRLVRHGRVLTSAEDFVYWFLCGIFVFYMLYRENSGVLRWFAVAGAALGMFFYKIIFRSAFVNVMSTCIHKIMWFLFRIIQIVLKPIKCAFSAARRCVRYGGKKCKKGGQFLKKRLTVCIKTLRMVLCKQ